MERLKIRREAVKRALQSLEFSARKFVVVEKDGLEDYRETRDSFIKRFEYSLDTFWKFLMLYMTDVLKVTLDQPSPKRVFQKALEMKLLQQEEYAQCLTMVDDRNMTSHTYNEALAEEISKQLPGYFELMHTIFMRLPEA